MPWLPSSALLPLLQEQSQKLNSRVTQLAGVVSSNKADQAHLNAQVNAELKRRQKVGSLHTTVNKLAKKDNKKVLDLAGIVEENAVPTSRRSKKQTTMASRAVSTESTDEGIMVSAWSSHDLDETNQETPYKSVRCLTNTRHCAAFLCINHTPQPPRCLLPACCVALGLWLGPLAWAYTKGQLAGGRSKSSSPGGPYQYCAVHRYSVVRRVWGASGVYKFLIFAPPTPPQRLVAALLSTPVRCSMGVRSPQLHITVYCWEAARWQRPDVMLPV